MSISSYIHTSENWENETLCGFNFMLLDDYWRFNFILLDLNDYFFDSNIRFTYLHFAGLASFLENKSTTGENN